MNEPCWLSPTKKEPGVSCSFGHGPDYASLKHFLFSTVHPGCHFSIIMGSNLEMLFLLFSSVSAPTNTEHPCIFKLRLANFKQVGQKPSDVRAVRSPVDSPCTSVRQQYAFNSCGHDLCLVLMENVQDDA